MKIYIYFDENLEIKHINNAISFLAKNNIKSDYQGVNNNRKVLVLEELNGITLLKLLGILDCLLIKYQDVYIF